MNGRDGQYASKDINQHMNQTETWIWNEDFGRVKISVMHPKHCGNTFYCNTAESGFIC